MKKQKNRSIRKKLTRVFVLVFAVVFIVNGFIYYNLNLTVSQVDNVYSSNIRLNELQENLENLQDQVYQYLSTKSSEALESYYVYEQDYRDLIANLNDQPADDPGLLLEKNIRSMSQTYLDNLDDTVEARRGRNVTRYKEGYEESEKLYDYLQTNINSLNARAFLHNAHNYSTLRVMLNYIMVSSIIALIVVMAVSILWAVMMTRSITRPLILLANAATEIAQGNMDVDFPIVETQDEVTKVAKACNKMINSIRDYIEKTRENYERESQLKENELIMKNDLKEAQLKYLQAQINPHFLFNSLNAGVQLAMMEGAERTCMFLQNMADFFRYNVRMMGKETILSEELGLVANYIYILNVRFSGDIHYTESIDERCLDQKMPGMILQPIFENAVNHGIREMEGDGKITLQVYSDQGNVCIRITDNGKGIDPEVCQRLMSGQPAGTDRPASQTGIGLGNVISRLRNYYNTHDVFTIAPLSQGTEVLLSLPRKKGDDENGKDTDL